MGTKIIRFIFLAVILIFVASPVFAEEILEPYASNIPTPEFDNSISPEQQQEINERERARNIFETSTIFLLIISLIISIFIIRFMISRNYLVLNIIIHSSVFLLGAGVTVMFLDGIRCLFSQYCSIASSSILLGLAGVPSFLFSLFIIWKLVWKKEYGNKYSVNMSSGIILSSLLFWVLVLMSELIIRPTYDLPTYLTIILTIVPVGIFLYFILGIIGLFVDKRTNSL